MRIQLVRVKIDEAKDLWEMQVRAFLDLYEKYQDAETGPATESMDQILMRLHQPFTYSYDIVADNTKVGAIRVVDRTGGRCAQENFADLYSARIQKQGICSESDTAGRGTSRIFSLGA